MESRTPGYWAGLKRKARPDLQGDISVPPVSHTCRIHLIQYREDVFQEQDITSIQELAGIKRDGLVNWISISGTPDPESLEALGRQFSLHPLALEDVAHREQHCKIEDYDNFLFVILYLPTGAETVTPVQVNIFLGKDFVISICEEGDRAFQEVRQRLQTRQGIGRKQGSDFLAYALCDAVVDQYFPVLANLGDRLALLEERTFAGASQEIVEEIHTAKIDLLIVGRSIIEAQAVFGELTQGENGNMFGPGVEYYLRDVLDHTHQMSRTVESYRQIADSILNSHLSLKNHQMNEIIKVLTIIATIFIPLTFIVGVYGMNFRPEAGPLNMPEITWAYGYPVVWGIMILIALVMLIIFRRKGWM